MQSHEIRLQDYISVVYRKKWAVIISTVLVLGISIYYALSKPPVYISSATVQIDTRTLNPSGEVVQRITQPVAYYDRIFRTGIFQKEVLDSLSAHVAVQAIAQREQVSLGDLVRYNLSLQADEVQGFFKITASASHPDLAFHLTDVSSRLFQKRCREIETENLRESDTYLDDQITLVRTRLEEAERELQQFLREHGMAYNEEMKGNRDLNDLQSKFEDIQLTRDLTSTKLRFYRQKRDELLGRTSSNTDRYLQDIYHEIRAIAVVNDSLNTARTALLQRYGAKHDSVAAIDREIRENRMRSLEIETRLTQTRPRETTSNLLPLIQSKIVQAEETLFELSADASYYEEKIRTFGEEHPNLLDQELKFSSLSRQKERFEATYNLLVRRREEQQFLNAMQTGGVKMIDPASIPQTPSPSNAPKQILFGAILGLSLGLSAAFLLEYMDTSLKSSEDISRFLEIPLMGEIPTIKTANQNPSRLFWPFKRDGKINQDTNYESKLITNYSPKDPVPEAYRNLRTSLQFAFVDEPLQCFVISSPGATEGKSLTTVNLAISFAQSGKKTVIIDTDLRRPVLHKIFGISKEPGITDVLLGDTDLQQAVWSTAVDGLYVLPAGLSSPNPGELINSQRMRDTIEQLKTDMDILILDTPPVIAAIDAAVLGAKTQGVLLVFHMDQTKREAAQYCIEQLKRTDVNIIGGLLNNIDVDKRYGYYYGYRYYYRYKYYYYSDNGERKTRKRKPDMQDA